MLSFFGLVTLGCDTFNKKDEHFAQEDGGIQRNFAQLSSGALYLTLLITDRAFLGRNSTPL
jgi:hypothetical protein